MINEKLIPVLTLLRDLSLEDLCELNTLLVDTIKRKRAALGAVVAQSLYVGCHVTVNHKKCIGEKYIITEIKQKKASVKRLDSQGKATSFGYNVPFNLLIPIVQS